MLALTPLLGLALEEINLRMVLVQSVVQRPLQTYRLIGIEDFEGRTEFKTLKLFKWLVIVQSGLDLSR